MIKIDKRYTASYVQYLVDSWFPGKKDKKMVKVKVKKIKELNWDKEKYIRELNAHYDKIHTKKPMY